MQTGQTDGWHPPWARRLHWPAFAAFCGSVALDLWLTSTNWANPTTAEILHGLPWLMGAVTLGVGLARSLPAQNVILAAAVSTCVSVSCGLLVDVPSEFSVGAVSQLVQKALMWLTLAVASIGVSRRCLMRFSHLRNFGHLILAVALILLVPLMGREDFVEGVQAPSGVTVGKELAQRGQNRNESPTPVIAIAALCQLALLMPILQTKQPSTKPVDWHSSIVLLVVLLWLEMGQRLDPVRRFG